MVRPVHGLGTGVQQRPLRLDRALVRVGIAVRGPFTFNNHGFPIQNMYAFVVAKDARGRVNLKTIAQPITAQRDSYADKCPIKLYKDRGPDIWGKQDGAPSCFFHVKG